MLSAGQLIAGRYEIDSKLGAGGMSVVYRAWDTKLERYISLKVLREELSADAEFVRRFPVEAMAAAALNHPNIVSIFDYGQDGAVYYIVLEYIDGANLKDIINHYAPFDNDATLGMAIQIADGLIAAHRAGIVHRDIKPHNILVDNNSSAKVADFGIARVARASTITAGESMGSAHYFSPEQARGGYVDHKTDIYSLGIVMYEMATGRLPFDGDNIVAVALQQINEPLPDLMELNPQISESVARIIYKATEKSPTRRYRDIEEMAADLKQALTDSSGKFVQAAEADATQTINQEDRAAIRKLQTPPAIKQKPDEIYPPEYDDYDDYDDEYDTHEQEELTPEDKKSNRISILVGAGFGLVVTVLILLAGNAIYQRLRTPRLSPPDVVGMTYTQAVTAARAVRLTISRHDSIFHNEIPEGYIIEQTPTHEHAGMAPGDAILVIVSMGPSPYTMPDIVGMDIEDARELLAGLPMEFAELDEEDEAEPGTVIRQNPEYGTPIGEGTPVFIYVSIGMEETEPAQVVVPNLLNLTQAQALDALREANLRQGLILQAESITFASGRVSGQSPMPGEVVDRETMVGFTVSTGSPVPTPGPPTPTPPPEDDPDSEDDDPDPEDDPTDPYDDDEPGHPGYTYQPGIPGISTRVLYIALWDVPAYTEFVHLRVMRHVQGQEPTAAFDALVFVNLFPFGLQIEGSGFAEYRVYAVEDGEARFITAYEINFDE